MSVAESLHQRTARQSKGNLRESIYQRIDGEDEITVEELVADAYRDLQQDEEFLEALLADGIALLIPPLAIQIWSNDRAFVQTATGAIFRGRTRKAEPLADSLQEMDGSMSVMGSTSLYSRMSATD